MTDYSKELEAAKKIALLAGEIMLKYFDVDDQKVQTKADNTPVTIADVLINEMVIKELSRRFPEDGIIGEEKSTSEYGMGRKWLCDPIDGTLAYVWGTPTSMFSLALVLDGKPVMGVAYDPFLNKIYYAVRGNGSFCNDKAIHVSDQGLEKSRIAITSSIFSIPGLTYLPRLKEVGARCATFSGAVYKSCLVAKGKFAAYIEHGVGCHDMAAVHVIVEEAGGKITGLKGETLDYSRPFKGAIVSNSKIHDQLVEVVNGK